MLLLARNAVVIAVTLSFLSAAHGASSIYLPVERIAETAPWIVEGSVARTASGFDPETGRLSTYVTVEVSYVYRGPSDLTTVILREPGGRIGDLVHEVDAVPVFEVGEHDILFLEPARDGALCVAGMFFGKLEILDTESGLGRIARRELSGQGLIVGGPSPQTEEFPFAEIDSLIASTRPGPQARALGTRARAVPPEFSRLTWDAVRDSGNERSLGSARPTADFVPLSTSYPARWHESDVPTAIGINIQPSGNPLNDNAAAVSAMRQAMAAWTTVPEARVVVQSANENYGFTGSNPQSPTVAIPPVNIILFNDPYNDISDPSGCSGTLAIGGYWRSGSGTKSVNGVTFYPILKQYVIFNNNFQCFLGNATNLAEVAAHELGHGIGFGHSAVTDALMRATAYGNGRGPRLGNDDRDGAHCHYPHTLAVTSPNGGESWAAGSTHTITWTATAEAGADSGTVDIEYSPDAGSTWQSLATAQPNSGSYTWAITSAATTQALVRIIRRNRVLPTPAPYPQACSGDASNAVFSLFTAIAGSAPDGRLGAPLAIAKGAGGALTLTWGASCSSSATNYAIYEGTLSALRSGVWDHLPKTCSAGTDRTETVTPAPGSSYYLVAPLAVGKEGLLGPTTSAGERPPSSSACAPRESASCS